MEAPLHIIHVSQPDDLPRPEFTLPAPTVAVGRVLNAAWMSTAYQRGWFAWTDRPVSWWSPDPRAIIPLDRFHLSRRLLRTCRQGRFRITSDQAFDQVVSACAADRPKAQRSWIQGAFFESFHQLYVSGHAHSVECWKGDELVGGVFGVTWGAFFSGESMFHRVTDASKVALAHLLSGLAGAGFSLFDIQMITPATAVFGAIEIPRPTYLKLLHEALTRSPTPAWPEFPCACLTSPDR